MTITVNNVEGSTSRKGSKQNKTYTIISQGSKQTDLGNGRVADLSNFYEATDGKREFQLWNLKGNWSELGIKKHGVSRMTYTKNFIVNN